MNPDRPLEKVFRRLIEVCIAGPGVLAVLVLLSWIFGRPMLGAFGHEYIPMAPSTAWLMILLSSSLFLHRHRPSKPSTRRFALFSIVTIGVVSLLILGQFFFGFDLPVEQRLVPSTETIRDIPIGRMSPLTALSFLGSALAFWFALPPLAVHRSYRQAASAMALAVLLISLISLFSYGIGAPLIFGSRIIPMAFFTAVSFVFLGLGILVTAGSDTWPLFLLKSGYLSPSLFIRGPLGVFLLVFIIIGTTGFFFLKYQLTELRRAALQEISAVVELKVNQISRWYNERLSDAGYFFEAPEISESVQSFLSDPSSLKKRAHVLDLMSSAQRNI
ncbi:MAG: hypothetical protein MUQ20_01355, partial [Deltaproteobacteria bacterium]|nr:hypothetical protein [Deltaproteobacteria bacterium]